MRVLREPLLHFAVLGAALFAVHRAFFGGGGAEPEVIVVDAARVELLSQQFERTSQRPPTATELDGLVESYVRDEVLYREGRAIGLDRDDPVIRNRVRMRMELLGEGSMHDLAQQDLQAWLDAHASLYASPARYDFRQLFFASERHGSRLDADVAMALEAAETHADASTADLGDATLLPAELQGVTRGDVAAQFGDELAAALDTAPPDRWFGPVRSAYGVHLIRVGAREPGRAAALGDVRDAVERDVREARASAAREQSYARLRARYTVRVDPPLAAAKTANAVLAAQP